MENTAIGVSVKILGYTKWWKDSRPHIDYSTSRYKYKDWILSMGREKNKHNAERCLESGIRFDSKMEALYYSEVVKPLMDSGEIVSCELQKPYVLQEGFERNGKQVRPITYKADFSLEYKDGRIVVIDIKGFADAQVLIKRKMFWHRYPDIDYQWITRSVKDGGWRDYDYVKRTRSERANKKAAVKPKKVDIFDEEDSLF